MTNPSRPSLQSTTAPAWHDALNGWTAQALTTGKAAATVDSYARHVSWLAGDLANVYPDPWELPAAALARWLDAQGWSAQTRRKVLVSLRAFYVWGMLEGLCQRSPLAGIPTVPPRKRGPERLRVPAPWEEPLADYLTALRAVGRSESTIEQRRWHLTRLAETYGKPWAVTTLDLERFMARDDWAHETKRAVRAACRSFYRWAEREGWTSTNPAAPLDSVRLRRTLPRPAPDAAVSHALAAADDRVRLALHVALYAGLRRAEIACIHTRDIGHDGLIVHGKGGHERLVPLHPELARLLQAELRRRREGGPLGTGWGAEVPPVDGWLFPSAQGQGQHLTPAHLGKLIAAALPPGWTTHTLRHRFATTAYQTHRDLRAVQELLGHARPETTARYAAVPTGALRDAVLSIELPPARTAATDDHAPAAERPPRAAGEQS